MLDRIFNGGLNLLTRGIRAALLPVTLPIKMIATGTEALGQFAQFKFGAGFSTLVGGTVNNAVDAGMTMAGGLNPLISFGEGFVRNKVHF